MTSAAHARRAATRPRREEVTRPVRVPAQRGRQTRQTRAQAARYRRLALGLVCFALCLTVLGVGRVALSFAVVQKSLQTDAAVHTRRTLEAENTRLAEDLARLSSAVRVSNIAQSRLGYDYADYVRYLKVKSTAVAAAGVKAR